MTLKQQMVGSKLLENAGNVSKSMIQAGYSPNSAKNPQRLVKSKSWPQLVEKYLPDKLLTERHNDLLNKKESIIDYRNGRRVPIKTDEIDTTAVARGLDMAYKLKNKYPVEKSGDTNVAIVNVMNYADQKPIEAEIVPDVAEI